jgi:hypothetical protein
MSVSKILHFAQGAGPLKIEPLGLQKRSIMVEVHGSLSACLSVFISILRHDFGKYTVLPLNTAGCMFLHNTGTIYIANYFVSHSRRLSHKIHLIDIHFALNFMSTSLVSRSEYDLFHTLYFRMKGALCG